MAQAKTTSGFNTNPCTKACGRDPNCSGCVYPGLCHPDNAQSIRGPEDNEIFICKDVNCQLHRRCTGACGTKPDCTGCVSLPRRCNDCKLQRWMFGCGLPNCSGCATCNCSMCYGDIEPQSLRYQGIYDRDGVYVGHDYDAEKEMKKCFESE